MLLISNLHILMYTRRTQNKYGSSMNSKMLSRWLCVCSACCSVCVFFLLMCPFSFSFFVNATITYHLKSFISIIASIFLKFKKSKWVGAYESNIFRMVWVWCQRFFEKLFMAILFTLRVFARNLLRENRRRITFLYFVFNVWP